MSPGFAACLTNRYVYLWVRCDIIGSTRPWHTIAVMQETETTRKEASILFADNNINNNKITGRAVNASNVVNIFVFINV